METHLVLLEFLHVYKPLSDHFELLHISTLLRISTFPPVEETNPSRLVASGVLFKVTVC